MTHKILDTCEACGDCIDECPTGAIEEGSPIYTIDPDICTDCAMCVEVCPTTSIIADE